MFLSSGNCGHPVHVTLMTPRAKSLIRGLPVLMKEGDCSVYRGRGRVTLCSVPAPAVTEKTGTFFRINFLSFILSCCPALQLLPIAFYLNAELYHGFSNPHVLFISILLSLQAYSLNHLASFLHPFLPAFFPPFLLSLFPIFAFSLFLNKCSSQML